MLKSIIKAKKISDSFSRKNTFISTNTKEIILAVNESDGGVIIDFPWDADADGVFMEYITVLLVKVTKDRIFFINPVKVSYEPCEITNGDMMGPERTIHEDGLESMSLINFFNLTKLKAISGIIKKK